MSHERAEVKRQGQPFGFSLETTGSSQTSHAMSAAAEKVELPAEFLLTDSVNNSFWC
jgi:hypothetical protein